ncbi:MAG: iron ABC transporter permease [Gemmatimonadetes bacterium]|nr:iron ABC transporter permease [Gemmatimonadota bacterium]
MRGGWNRRVTLLLTVPTGLVLLWTVVYPNLFVLGDSLVEGGRITLAGYREFLATRAELEALWASLWISVGSVVLSALVGVPLAFLFSRYEFPGRSLFGALAALPVLLPPLVGVIAFLFLYGESGMLTRVVQTALGLESAPWRLVGGPAILLVHAYTMYVYFYLFTLAGLARLDEGALEAAASLGASRLRTLRSVTLPMLAPALGAAALLVFMTSMASFSAPYIFGGGFRVLTTQIFASKLSGATTMAMTETVVLASASLAFLWLLRRYERGREYAAVGKGIGRARRLVRSRWARTVIAGAGIGVVLVLLLPHLTLLLVSFVPEGGWTTEIVPSRYTLENYRDLMREPDLLTPALNSLQMATLATAANVVFCFVAAYLVVRGRFPARGLINTLLVVPWALPGTVIAIGLAATFSVHQPWAGRFVLIGTFWILPMAYFIRNTPLVAQAAIASFRQFDPSLEEAAHSLGAGWLLTMRRVALPLVLPGLAAGALLAFVTALGEFVASILLYTHRSRPISIEILGQLRAFDFGGAAALGVILAVLMALAFWVGGRFVRGGPAVGG